MQGESSVATLDDRVARLKKLTGAEDMISMFGVTEKDVADIKETEFLYKQVLPRGHLIAIVGLPGSGENHRDGIRRRPDRGNGFIHHR